MKIADFDYILPRELIAQYPPKIRGETRLIVLNRKDSSITHKNYQDFIGYMNAGDVLVLNDTKVLPARLYAYTKEAGKRVEIFLLKNINPIDNQWEALIGRADRLKKERILVLEDSHSEIEIIGKQNEDFFIIKLPIEAQKIIEKSGHVPLPPYIKRADTSDDIKRYQTIFAKINGAVAAPTASLNMTQKMLDKASSKGVKIVYVTLHVGWDTFAPIREVNVEEHSIHSEWFEVNEESAQEINRCREIGGKIFAVGTTAARVLETCTDEDKVTHAMSGDSRIYIYPGYKFKCVDALITNFHAPRTTVLMLACAFANKNLLMKGYEEAKIRGYKFLSYGDSMLIL